MEDLSTRKTIWDGSLVELEDHFLGTGVATGVIGSLGWTETNSAAGTNTIQAGAVNHPGVIRLVTGAVSGNNKRLHLGSTASEPTFTPTNVSHFRFVCRIPTLTTMVLRLGLMQDVSAVSGGTAAAVFQYDPTVSGQWTAYTRQASVSAAIAQSGNAIVASNWYLLEARREQSGAWNFLVNGVSIGVFSTNLPTTDCAFGVLLQTATAAARNVDIDYAYVRATVGQLFT